MTTKQAEGWLPTRDVVPHEGARVDWIATDGSIVSGGQYVGGLWFLPERNGHAIYVYYTPHYWRDAHGAK